MGNEKDANSNPIDRSVSPPEDDVGGKLRLNKETLQDLSPTDEHADKVRGGAISGRGGCWPPQSGVPYVC